MITTKAGAQGFRWFFGVVEDREDPLEVGRVRVRVYNTHPQKKSLVNTEDLHWAFVIGSINSAGHQQVGVSPTGMMVGSVVFGFFADGEESQMPIILGTLASIPGGVVEQHDVAKLARGINDISKALLGPEPASAYGAKYPFNKVMRTESGHVIEVDDTPGSERIHVFHKSGTYNEVNSVGRKVDKVVGDNYHIVAGNEEVYIEGSVNVRVKGDVNITVDGNYTLNVTGNVIINGSIINLNHGSQGAARIGDTADTGDAGDAVGSNVIESGSGTVLIGD